MRVGRRLLLLAWLLVPDGRAQGPDTLRLVRLNGPIVLDGRVDEPAWEAVPPLPLVVFAPQYRMPPTERTEIRVAYDDRYLYVSGRLYDSDPKGIRARTLYRDNFAGDDHFCFALDTYNDYQSAVWFCVNPAGTRGDQTIANDGDFSTFNRDWNTYWDAATTQNDQGWFAEIRVPFSSLGFQEENGRVIMGLSAYRFIARKNERHIFPDIPPSVPAGFIPVKPSRMARVILEGVHRRTPVYVTPYGLGGFQQQAALNAEATGYEGVRDTRREVGLDVRYSPSPSLTLDLTANTDFAQVEADDQQINLTRFPLFFPEKRQFFQERAELFAFGLGGGPFNRLFHSRRIGLVEGRPIRLLGGVRLVGRRGGTDVGLLNMQTAAERGLPSENFGVLRLRQQVFNPYSNAGLMLTSRVAEDGSYNVASGVDALVRVVGDEYLTLRLAHTFEDGQHARWLDASHLLLRWERRVEGGFSYAAELVRSGEAFNPAVGFLLRRNFTALDGRLQYLWFGGPRSPFRTFAVQGTLQGFRRNEDDQIESVLLAPALEAEFKSGHSLSLAYRANYESVPFAFAIAPEVTIPVGDYWFHEAELRFESRPGTNIRPDVAVTAGQFYDGHRVSLLLQPALNLSRHLELSADYSLNRIRFPARDQAVNMHLLRLRVRAAYDVHLSLSAFLQYNSVSDQFDMNLRLRYNVRDGTDLWIVYNETLHTDREAWHPMPPRSLGRALLVKYTHTFIW